MFPLINDNVQNVIHYEYVTISVFTILNVNIVKGPGSRKVPTAEVTDNISGYTGYIRYLPGHTVRGFRLPRNFPFMFTFLDV